MLINILIITIFNLSIIGCFFGIKAPDKNIPDPKIELSNLYKKEKNGSISIINSKINEKVEEVKQIENKKQEKIDEFKKKTNIVDIIDIIDNG